ncbi:type II toxin-antitoxin system RelE/ParE family toxin [Streptomyces viridochromogenes]
MSGQRGPVPGGAEQRRLHHGPWRILYRVAPDTRTVHIEHVGRTGA